MVVGEAISSDCHVVATPRNDTLKQIPSTMKKSKPSKKITELETGIKRCLADFENYRKRVEEDKRNLQQLSKIELMLELLPIVDNFELALNHLSNEQKKDPAIAGIFHIQSQLISVMNNLGVEKIPAAIGDRFDPNLHEAVDSHQGKGGDVIHQIQRHGYRFGEKVLRPVKVTVRELSS